MSPQYIITVNEADFEYEVIAYSNQTPVLVDFWAEWCRPCKSLTPILERLTEENKGSFRLAKVDVDENPNLALRYGVRSIPNVKAFRDGQVVSEFLGLQPENRIKEFIRNIAPSKADLLLDKGRSYLEMQNWKEAANAYHQFLEKSNDHPAGLLGLLKANILLGNLAESMKIIGSFPASPEYSRVQLLIPLLDALSKDISVYSISENPLDAAYQNTIQLIKRGNIPASMDGLLDILRQEKHFKNDAPRKVLLALFEILGDEHPLTQQYRKELALVLF